MPIVRGQWAELLAPGLNLNTFQALQQFPEMYRRIVNVQNSRRAYEDDFRIAGFGPLVKKGELETTILDEPVKLGGARFIHQTFALGFAISQEMRDDDQYGVMVGLARELGVSSYYTTELYGHDVINNGFSAAKYVGRDGKALYATDHPIGNPSAPVGTWANRPAVDVDLSEAALEAGIGAFDVMLNDRGMPALMQASRLIIHPSQRFLAKRLLQSQNMPGSANNDINPLVGEGVQVLTDPWLTDLDAWHLWADPSRIDVRFYWREMPDTKTWDDDDSDAVFHKIRQRHSTGFGDPKGTYGSPGA